MADTNLAYYDIFPTHHDNIKYRRIDAPNPKIQKYDFGNLISLDNQAIHQLAYHAFHDINHYLRTNHLAQLAKILQDSEASPNDKYVALELLKNANIAAGGLFPMCQDTGTAIVMAKKGQNIRTQGNDEAVISHAIMQAYQDNNLRYSQLSPLSMFVEKNTKNNLPAQIDIYAQGDDSYKFLFVAKGGGSANKSFLYQPSPSVLEETKLLNFLEEKLKTLGTSACPPYHLAVVIGGLSAEMTMKIVKLTSTGYLDNLPTSGGENAVAFRDKALEERILAMTMRLGIGAQFGGKYFCHDVRVVRLPRHGASLPIGLGVSCAADRQVLGKITADGVFLEELETNPAQFLPEIDETSLVGEAVPINCNQPMAKILEILSKYPVKTRVSLSGTLIVARDLAHKKLSQLAKTSKDLPQYFKDHPIYYAGPAKTPQGFASGSFGPTTAGRMDGFIDEFQAMGGSLISLAKGNRSSEVKKACQKYGGFYLGSIGGPGAKLGKDVITKVEVLDFAELGMEAVWRIEVKNMPAFIVIDDKGNDFFDGLI